MATIILRQVKGSPLTNFEVDGNFANLNSDIGVLTNLTTSAKANLVVAVNEVKKDFTDGADPLPLVIALS